MSQCVHSMNQENKEDLIQLGRVINKKNSPSLIQARGIKNF